MIHAVGWCGRRSGLGAWRIGSRYAVNGERGGRAIASARCRGGRRRVCFGAPNHPDPQSAWVCRRKERKERGATRGARLGREGHVALKGGGQSCQASTGIKEQR